MVEAHHVSVMEKVVHQQTMFIESETRKAEVSLVILSWRRFCEHGQVLNDMNNIAGNFARQH